MDESSIRLAIKDFVDDNKADWVSGIVHQGAAREFVTISVTRLTPPTGGYHINISTRSPTTVYNDSVNSNLPIVDETSYLVIIELADFIFAQQSEDTLYQTMVFDFLIVRDRIVNSITTILRASNGKLTYGESDYYIDIDYGIRVNNSEEFIINDFPIMYSSIELKVRGC